MNRDVTTAAIAAFGLISLAGIWALFNAERLADPGGADGARPAQTSLPVPPKLPDRSVARRQAEAVFASRDLLRGEESGSESQPRLAVAKIDPPVRLDPVTAPLEQRLRTRPVPPPRTAIIAPPQPAPSPQTVIRPTAPPTPAASVIERYQRPPPEPQPMQPINPDAPSIRLRGIVPHPVDGVRVLLAISDGRIVTASLGAQVEGWQVVKIGQTSVTLLARNGRAVELRMLGY